MFGLPELPQVRARGIPCIFMQYSCAACTVWLTGSALLQGELRQASSLHGRLYRGWQAVPSLLPTWHLNTHYGDTAFATGPQSGFQRQIRPNTGLE
jgi:hypothetical protein